MTHVTMPNWFWSVVSTAILLNLTLDAVKFAMWLVLKWQRRKLASKTLLRIEKGVEKKMAERPTETVIQDVLDQAMSFIKNEKEHAPATLRWILCPLWGQKRNG